MFIFDPTDLPPLEVRKANLASPFMIEVEIGKFTVQRCIVDPGSSINVMSVFVYKKLGFARDIINLEKHLLVKWTSLFLLTKKLLQLKWHS